MVTCITCSRAEKDYIERQRRDFWSLEEIMSAISFPGWQQVRDGFAEWRHQARLHNELMDLNDRYREDIGLRRRTGDYNPSVPFRLM